MNLFLLRLAGCLSSGRPEIYETSRIVRSIALSRTILPMRVLLVARVVPHLLPIIDVNFVTNLAQKVTRPV